jgi:hypothetical protein
MVTVSFPVSSTESYIIILELSPVVLVAAVVVVAVVVAAVVVVVVDSTSVKQDRKV